MKAIPEKKKQEIKESYLKIIILQKEHQPCSGKKHKKINPFPNRYVINLQLVVTAHTLNVTYNWTVTSPVTQMRMQCTMKKNLIKTLRRSNSYI